MPSESCDPRPVIVLVRPQLGENIGAACRAMLNFGLEEMRIVSPRDGWPNPAAEAMASGAGSVLRKVEIFESTEDALFDLHFVMATTARRRDLTKDVLSPEDAVNRSTRVARHGMRSGLLFGPERSGLENSEVVLANCLVTIPVNPAFPSLNIAQSVVLLAYEWWKKQDRIAHASGYDVDQRNGALDSRPVDGATFSEVQHFSERLECTLDQRRFFEPSEKSARMKLILRNLISRLPLTSPDVRLLHGILGCLSRTSQDPN
ncbi:MAG: RNA methyltransferase [Paracoccaceae bacterium]|nr:RNA methyltransferase [Paracoccaceae bacterium]